MIDIHSHILPGLDDGAKEIQDTLKMIKEASDAGFTDVFATSHYIEGEYDFDKIDRECIIEAIMSKLEQDGINLKLHIGAEAYISTDLPKLVNNQTIPTLENSRYILFELPLRAKVMYTESIINKLNELDLIPIIAHPERYEIVQEDPNIAIEWVKSGAMLQSNYGSILGVYGVKAKETLKKLLDVKAVHFLGTDTHRPNSFYIKMDEIKKDFIKTIGNEEFDILSYINPKLVLEDKEIEIEEPKKIKTRRFF